ncbi:phosphopantetheine-binding protein [Candidatus Colwellia aromaticivorans]|uniref:phosphopantetheine-binding protein n=1 Tax=Candidatus Colwellia aromaticivorans TaxID=2267621 RepID=UPI000DF27D8B|nr:phosphopantetheine-binding protein [Candidatus Colwellia aromaticivorans]
MTLEDIIALVQECLQLDDVSDFDQNTELLGCIPEFDSMAIVTILTTIEDNYGVMIEDDEIDADVFETLGTLMAFVQLKLS